MDATFHVLGSTYQFNQNDYHPNYLLLLKLYLFQTLPIFIPNIFCLMNWTPFFHPTSERGNPKGFLINYISKSLKRRDGFAPP